MTRFRIRRIHEIRNVSKTGSQTNKDILTKLIPKLLMIVVIIKFKFEDLIPIIGRDAAG